MKFSLTTLYVEDMDKALEFYNKIMEMPIIRKQPMGPGKELVFLGVDGDVNLELIPADGKVDYSGFSIGFTVDDLQMMKERLQQNGYAIHREMDAGETATLCFLKGPCGEEVELVHYK